MFGGTRRAFTCKKDFDAWAYSIDWPQRRSVLPLLNVISLAVEDIKFAYNAWSLLRLAMFYGVGRPKVLSDLVNTTPSMDISLGGNRLFYLHARVGEPLSERRVKIALTPDHPKAVPVQQFPWREEILRCRDGSSMDGLELVLGMENGLSEPVACMCDHYVYIAQYGSIGSLSMISALAIATHIATAAALSCSGASSRSDMLVPTATPVKGHMPQSNHPGAQMNPRPHETNLLHLSNADIVELLRQRRMSYALQVGVLMYNALGDRNIGAVMRNANAFNCEEMIILNRRRFNRRGAVGTNHLLRTSFVESAADPEFSRLIEGYEVWLLYQYYPYLGLCDGDDGPHYDSESTFVRHEDSRLLCYLATGHVLHSGHPLTSQNALLTCETALCLDDEASLMAGVRGVKEAGLKGILLAVPEEGSVTHPEVVAVCSRVLFVTDPNNLVNRVQRGLNAALSTAVALERIRTCIDNL